MAIKYVIKKCGKYLYDAWHNPRGNVVYTKDIYKAVTFCSKAAAKGFLAEGEEIVKVDIQIKEIKNDK